MSKKSNLTLALQNVSGKTPVYSVQNDINSNDMPPSRQGKRAITGFFDPAVSKQLKQLALNEDKTIQLLLSEALNDLFIKYSQKPIA